MPHVPAPLEILLVAGDGADGSVMVRKHSSWQRGEGLGVSADEGRGSAEAGEFIPEDV